MTHSSEPESGTVLVVDDDPDVRDLCAASLRKAGYPVQVVADSSEAEAFLRRNRQSVRLLLSDVEMPRFSGVELAHMAAGSPCRILLMSGHAAPAEVAQRGWTFLAKPFLPDLLIRTVRELLLRAAHPKALVAEDNDDMRDRLCGLLHDDYDVIAALKGGASVVQKSGELHPDVIILDISMPEMSGFEVARRLRDSLPETPIVFVTQHTQAAYVSAAFATGAAGYVTKNRVFSELGIALQEVRAGGRYLSSDLRSQ